MSETENALDDVMRICELMKHELLAVIHSLPTSESHEWPTVPDWMTAKELAKYWRIHNPQGGPTTAGILKWTKRPPDQFPLPHAYMGDLLRFNREDVDKWAKEEAERRRIQNERKRFKIA
jgi:hypothetical protein